METKKVTTAMHDKFMTNSRGEQTFLSTFADPEEDYYKSAKYCTQIAITAWQQLCGSLLEDNGEGWQNVLWSWGIERKQAIRWRHMPALALKVNGYAHKGHVIISLDEGQDLYEVECATANWVPVDGKRETELYCDMLGRIIDRMVETGGMTDKEYQDKASEDWRNMFK